MSGASERANGRASGPVLTSRFLFVPDHSGVGDGVVEVDVVVVKVNDDVAKVDDVASDDDDDEVDDSDVAEEEEEATGDNRSAVGGSSEDIPFNEGLAAEGVIVVGVFGLVTVDKLAVSVATLLTVVVVFVVVTAMVVALWDKTRSF